jgi:hypothetical protein
MRGFGKTACAGQPLHTGQPGANLEDPASRERYLQCGIEIQIAKT